MAEVSKIDIDGVEWDIRDDILTTRFEQFLQQRETQRSYSTNEINTGKKWVDNKPIYRKCIPLLNSITISGDWTTFSNFLVGMNVKQIIKGSFKRRSDNAIIVPEAIRAVNNDLQFQVYANWGSFDLAILEYTKTTD